mgnify:CR=1 FL=1
MAMMTISTTIDTILLVFFIVEIHFSTFFDHSSVTLRKYFYRTATYFSTFYTLYNIFARNNPHISDFLHCRLFVQM